jgi:hypothetical protein
MVPLNGELLRKQYGYLSKIIMDYGYLKEMIRFDHVDRHARAAVHQHHV